MQAAIVRNTMRAEDPSFRLPQLSRRRLSGRAPEGLKHLDSESEESRRTSSCCARLSYMWRPMQRRQGASHGCTAALQLRKQCVSRGARRNCCQRLQKVEAGFAAGALQGKNLPP